jgi:hypothetical protein
MVESTCCLYDEGRNDFDAGNIHKQAHGKTFLGPEMATRRASAISGPKIVYMGCT